MQDLEHTLETLTKAKAECDLIAQLAADDAKRAIYNELSERFQRMIVDVTMEIARRGARRPQK